MISEVPSLAIRPSASRIETFSKLNAALVILSLASVFILPSQSASSFITYFLALSVLVSARILWSDARDAAALIGFIVVLLVYLPLTSFWSEPFSWRGFFSVSIRSFLVLAFILTFSVSLSRVVWFEMALSRTMSGCALTAATAALIGYVRNPPWDGRLVGFGQLEVNVFAALVFGVSLIFALHLVLHDRGLWKLLGWIAVVVLACAVILSGSRNAWMSVTLGALVYLFSNRIRRPTLLLVWIALLVLVAALFVVSLLQVNPESQALLLPRNDSFRLEIWSKIFDDVVEQGLWFGKGILSDNNVFSSGLEFLHPHSLYLTVFFDGGVLGIALFLGLVVVTMRALIHTYQEPVAKLGLGVLFLALFGYSLDGWEVVDKVGSTWLLLWMPVGIAIKLNMDRLQPAMLLP